MQSDKITNGDDTKDLHPVAFESRCLSGAELKYTTSEKELLATVHAYKKFEPYLYGVTETIDTDHRPLLTLNNDARSKVADYRLFRSELNKMRYKIVYIAGTKNVIADALSRHLVNKPCMPEMEEPENCLIERNEQHCRVCV